MGALLTLARAIDAVNGRIGRLAAWLVLAAILVSAGNAISRKAFSLSSNAWLELQWYLFGAVFMLAAAWTLMRDEHVRIDILSSRLPRGYRNVLDVIGHALFLIPFAAIHMWLAWPYFLSAARSGELSSNAGGLLIWPARLAILIGFTLLLAQGVSELIKRIAVLAGRIPDEGAPDDSDDGRGRR